MARHSKKSGAGKTILIILIILIVIAVIFIVSLMNEISGKGRKEEGVNVTIPMGASTQAVANALKESGVIKNTLLFRYYSRQHNADGTYQYGDFTVIPAEGYDGIIKTLQQSVVQVEGITVTFPEGYNAFQMGEVLEESGLCTKDEFIDAANSHTFDVSFFDMISDSSLKVVKLEGFLYPDTYEFFEDAGVDKIILTMLQNFEEKVMTDERMKQFKESGYTLDEWAAFASVIQEESLDAEEMYKVSSVFNNRLVPGSGYGKLESDTTYFYIYDYIEPFFGGNPPQKVVDAYDSYSLEGLPVGAISCPGVDAFDAALNPADTPYYFFVTDIENTYYYAETFSEHLANIEKAKAVNLEHGKVGL